MNIDIEILYEQYLNSDEYAKVIKGHTKLKNDLEKFKSIFKFNELHLLTKEKYAIGEKSFINWIQRRLVEHGSIVRGAQDKFGIYYGPLGEDETHDWRINKIWINDMNDTDISMSQLAENIQKLVTNFNNFDIYKDIKIAETIKLKILSIYYPDDFLPMYSSKYIKQLLDIVGKEYNYNECGYQLNKKLLNYKESNTFFKNIDKYIFSTFLNYLLNFQVEEEDKIIKSLISNKELEKLEFNKLISRDTTIYKNQRLKVDFPSINKAKKIAGDLAEKLVFEYETKLGNDPKHISKDDDFIGYDIESTMPNGTKKLIEVKSLAAGSLNKVDFFISENEYNNLLEKENYYIYYVFNVRKSPQFIEINREDLKSITPKIAVYKYTLKSM